jgi:hypothetical protein
MGATDKLRRRRLRRQRRFERPLRDLAGYLVYAAAPLLEWLQDRKSAKDDPLRTSAAERREHARRRPFYGADAMGAYLERMLLWFYLSVAFLALWIPGNFVLQPDESRPVALHVAVDYLPQFGLWMSLTMLLISGTKLTTSWIFSAQQFGRDTEAPFEDHGIDFDIIDEDPELADDLDPPAPILGRLLRPFLTPSNTETLIGVLVGLFMTYGAALNDPALHLAHAGW